MNADGTNERRLTYNEASDEYPFWRSQPRIIPESYEFVTKWGSYGTGDGQFSEPFGIAVDSSGYVYVGDYNNGRVQKFTSSGTFLGWWGRDNLGYTGWHNPDSGRTGVYGSGDGEFYYPFFIAVDSSGYVYVGDYNNGRVQKFTSNGDFLAKWGSEDTGDGQFYTPIGLTIDSFGYVYVTDAYNRRIQKFTSNGSLVTAWGSAGSGNGQFNSVHGIAVDSSGFVYVADGANNRIQKFRKK